MTGSFCFEGLPAIHSDVKPHYRLLTVVVLGFSRITACDSKLHEHILATIQLFTCQRSALACRIRRLACLEALFEAAYDRHLFEVVKAGLRRFENFFSRPTRPSLCWLRSLSVTGETHTLARPRSPSSRLVGKSAKQRCERFVKSLLVRQMQNNCSSYPHEAFPRLCCSG